MVDSYELNLTFEQVFDLNLIQMSLLYGIFADVNFPNPNPFTIHQSPLSVSQSLINLMAKTKKKNTSYRSSLHHRRLNLQDRAHI